MTTVFCYQCKEKVSIDNVRYAPNGKDLICLSCLSRAPKEKQATVVHRTRFQCTSCNYKFSFRKDSRIQRKCPFCASTKVALRDDVTSSSVLDDVAAHPEFVLSR